MDFSKKLLPAKRESIFRRDSDDYVWCGSAVRRSLCGQSARAVHPSPCAHIRKSEEAGVIIPNFRDEP